MTNPYQFDEPDEVGGSRLNPVDIIGHLLLVWAVDYIEHSPTKFSKPDKPSDVIVVDVADLDLPDENGYAGFLCRESWWRQARLIGALRQRLDVPRPVLVHMAIGQATVGNPPYELHSANGLPECVARAQAWMAANPDFRKSVPRGKTAVSSPAPAQQEPVQVTLREPSLLERLAAQAASGVERITPSSPPAPVPPPAPRPLPPPPPSPPPAFTDEPPF